MYEKSQTILVISIAIFLVVALILIFVLRFTVFKTGKHLTTLSNDELSQKGYGTYSQTTESPCVTANGKCSYGGVKYITEYCVQHPDTGNGCIDENGEQTLATRSYPVK